MKCLSVKQPYADLIATGAKTIELRSWDTKYRGRLLIHASSVPDVEGVKRFNIDTSKLATGAIVAEVLLYDVKKYHNISELMEDKDRHLAGQAYIDKAKFGFLLREARKITPIPMKGSLGIFEVDIKG
ncbi:MAG TPA: ASCH domain-containing protein [Candidatus Baltobacteraceae bacterium]|nr:ASCH domain-containing protein [Candidatus Baltobacteraceae bacterium]